MPSLVKIGPVVLEKKSQIGKVHRLTHRRTDGRTDRRIDRRRTINDQKRSLELSAQISYNHIINNQGPYVDPYLVNT